MPDSKLLRELANCIRFLAIDAVQRANSGHPGMPMGMADIATVLWREFLTHNPNNSHWLNRDRFILSNGHGSMLHYALLHLTGYNLTIDDLKLFRQLHSKTPGHPEQGETLGIEATTGPLGQGLANGVGMALAEKLLSQRYNRENFNIIDHYTYVFLGDGCLMEGISHEVAALAGIWQLNKLILFWDNNHISIDGEVSNWFEKDVATRFRSYGWHVIDNLDGHDFNEIRLAIAAARETAQPSLLCCKTHIGYGSPNKIDRETAHGSPLGQVEVLATRKNLNWDYPEFSIPEKYYNHWDYKKQGEILYNNWQDLYHNYKKHYPELAHELERRLAHNLPDNFSEIFDQLINQAQTLSASQATRAVNRDILAALIPIMPELLGGSADLSESTGILWSKSIPYKNNNINNNFNYLQFGVREFGMAAILNGLSLYGGFIPYSATFLAFLSYNASAVRMAALMKLRAIYIFTHDSIGLGEDGPTHQPIEQLSLLRATPNLSVWRPCDHIETIIAWREAILRTNGPTVLCLTRQAVQPQSRTIDQINNISRGGYIIYENFINKNNNKNIDLIILATGSEVEIAISAAKNINNIKNIINIRVVSMPSVDRFLEQDKNYQELILPKKIKKRIAIEAGATQCWYRFIGLEGGVLGIDQFGYSAPAIELYKFFNLTVENLCKKIQDII